MGRKRFKNRLKRRIIHKGKREMPKGRTPKKQNNLFDDPWFWLNLATIDFCGFFGIRAESSTEGQPPHKENKDE